MMEIESIPVGRATRAIGRWLLRSQGGTCVLTVGEVTRVLSHDPILDGPVRRLPWPFSLVQPHEFQYGERPEVDPEDRRFSRTEVGAAIMHFVRDAPPTSEVQFMP